MNCHSAGPTIQNGVGETWRYGFCGKCFLAPGRLGDEMHDNRFYFDIRRKQVERKREIGYNQVSRRSLADRGISGRNPPDIGVRERRSVI